MALTRREAQTAKGTWNESLAADLALLPTPPRLPVPSLSACLAKRQWHARDGRQAYEFARKCGGRQRVTAAFPPWPCDARGRAQEQ